MNDNLNQCPVGGDEKGALSAALLAHLRSLFGASLGSDGVELVAGGFLSCNFILAGGGERYFLKRYRFEEADTVRTIHQVKGLFAEAGFPVVMPVTGAHGTTLVTHADGNFALFPFA